MISNKGSGSSSKAKYDSRYLPSIFPALFPGMTGLLQRHSMGTLFIDNFDNSVCKFGIAIVTIAGEHLARRVRAMRNRGCKTHNSLTKLLRVFRNVDTQRAPDELDVLGRNFLDGLRKS